MSWINVGIAAVGVVSSAYSAKRQRDQAGKLGKDPVSSQRTGYSKDLQTMMDDPSSFYSNPMYQSAYGQGQQAVTRGLASQGYAGSGNMATGLQQYGQSFGFGMFKDYSKFLAELAGFTFNNNNPQVAAQGTQWANQGLEGAFGQLGGIAGLFGPSGSTAGTPAAGAGGGGGLSWGNTGSGGSGYNVGGGSLGSWDAINAGGP